MKRVISCLIMSVLLMTGCSSNPQVLMPYESNAILEESLFSKGDSFPLFSDSKAVIDEKEWNTVDQEMMSSGSLLINRTTNEVLYADHVYEQLFPASITKLATALMVLKYSDLNAIVTVSKNAASITESGAKLCGWKAGDQISMRTLLNALLVYSGNDAGIAIAEYIGGTEEEFASMMNEELRTLGATQTHFTNAHGLHNEQHYSSAYDIYLMFDELLRYEEFVTIIKQSSYEADYLSNNGTKNTKTFTNTNQYLLHVIEAPNKLTVLGGKTGTTDKAGYCLIILSQDKHDQEYISLVLNASSKVELYNQMNHLLMKIPS